MLLAGIISAFVALGLGGPVAEPAVPASTATPPEAPLLTALLHELTGREFRVRESPHFRIHYDTDHDTLRRLVGRLEGTHGAVKRFAVAAGFERAQPAKRMAVILFDGYDDFLQYARREGLAGTGMAGFYSQQSGRSAFFNALGHPDLQPVNEEIARLEQRLGQATERGRREADLRSLTAIRARRDRFVNEVNQLVIQHEAAHQILFHMGLHMTGAMNPPWLVEGLACQFEVPQTDSRGRLARVNHLRLADFRDTLGVALEATTFSDEARAEAVREGRWLPLCELIVTRDAFHQGGDGMLHRYAQSWALVHYLQREQGEALNAYLRMLAMRKPGEFVTPDVERAAFESAFGTCGEPLESSWIAAMLGLRLDRREAGRE